MIGEVQWKRREDSINIKKGGCGVTFSPSLVIKGGGGELVRSYFLDNKYCRQEGER